MLTIVSASAGSGKTTYLCETVAARVREGLDPARILATTFTRKAAAELKQRMLAEILRNAAGDSQSARKLAERLELATIGTVHSVAHQLIRRYAISLGLSPDLQPLTEADSNRVQRELLGMIDPEDWEKLSELVDRLSVTGLHDLLLDLLGKKLQNRIDDTRFESQMLASAGCLCEILAPLGPCESPPSLQDLYESATTALGELQGLTADTTAVTQKAKVELQSLVRRRETAWSVYPQAMSLKAGVRSGADQRLNPLRELAGKVRRHPGLHEDIVAFAKLLARQVIQLESRYRNYKHERGLLDYTDLEIQLLELLEREDLAGSLGREFDLTLVDEFQDSSALQLAIFQKLLTHCPNSYWVGDPKQSIYAFRDATPELVTQLWSQIQDAARAELRTNYRSQKGLVELTGRLFQPVLGAEAEQVPSQASEGQGIERWILQTANQADDAIAMARGIAALIQQGWACGQIAVLERVNKRLDPLAKCLEDLGIPYLLESPGLLSTREGALVLAGLRMVADSGDTLAAACVVHLLANHDDGPPPWLQERLSAMAAADPDLFGPDDPDLSALRRLDRSTASPQVIMQQVISALRLPSRLNGWGDASRRSANLDSLLQHAASYEDTAVQSGTAATLNGLILHLDALAAEQSDARVPPRGLDAVTLTTYHSAKGLEWPVLILSSLDYQRNPDVWSPEVTGGETAGDRILSGRQIRYWSWPFGTVGLETGTTKLRSGSGLNEDALESCEGVRLRNQDEQERLRLLYVGVTRAKSKVVFVHRPDKYQWLAMLPGIDHLLAVQEEDGEYSLEGIDTTLVIRHLSADQIEETRPVTEAAWIDVPPVPAEGDHLARYHRPSLVAATMTAEHCRIESLSDTPFFPIGARTEDAVPIGNAIHTYLGSLPSLAMLDQAGKCAVAGRSLNAFAVAGLVSPEVLVAAGERFESWVRRVYPDARWQTEVDVSSVRSQGGQWTGTIDLLLELPDGTLVIVDHKSAPIRREHCAAKAAEYSGQLSAYSEVLQTGGFRIAARWIHFPLAGAMVSLG
jgi:ATP-dependent exoDNAse (exonuclease V) beta subunit